MMLLLGTAVVANSCSFHTYCMLMPLGIPARSLNFVANRVVVPSGITFFRQSYTIFDQITFTGVTLGPI